MEVEFVRGVRMREEMARNVNSVSKRLGLALSVHAPYYINLNSPDPGKFKASIERIKKSARIGWICGAKSIVFHTAFYMKSRKSSVLAKVKKTLMRVIEDLSDEGVEVILRPETTGKRTQFGSLEEVVSLSAQVEGIQPCVDFSHLHARTGRANSEEEFKTILSTIETHLGRRARIQQER
jgi:deoxyribonuclease-4